MPGVRKENDEPGGEADTTLVDVSGGDWDSMGTGSQGKLNGYIMSNLHSSRSGSVTGEGYNNLPPPARSNRLGASDDCPSSERENVVVQHTSGSDEGAKSATALSSLPSTDESGWDFGRFLEEQRLKEIQHEDRKKNIFQKVRDTSDMYLRRWLIQTLNMSLNATYEPFVYVRVLIA